MKSTYLLLTLFILGIFTKTQAQKKYWTATTATKLELDENYRKLDQYTIIVFDKNAFLLEASKRIKPFNVLIPISENKSELFIITPSFTMPPELCKKFPSIKSYSGHSVLNPTKKIRLDINPTGLHAMIIENEERIFIDPINRGASQSIIYNEQDYKKVNKYTFPESFNAELFEQKKGFKRSAKSLARISAEPSKEVVLHKFRLAISCSAGYTQSYGGTKEKALAGIVTTVNRLNEVFENDLAISFELVSNNEDIIFIDSATDPFTADNAFDLVEQNQTQIDQIIGDANYDIGHHFTTSFYGLGFPGVCKKGDKAEAVSGTRSPRGDTYDIRTVAHEIGHQFSASHSYNGDIGLCNRSVSTAWEPGSGSTIMGYAGLCRVFMDGNENIQEQTDPYFHGGSIDEILGYINEKATCAEKIFVKNTTPIITIENDNLTIPVSTPFVLDANATDAEDTNLTYCWEQFDLGPTGPLDTPTGNAPIFRSIIPTKSSKRYFPNLNNLSEGLNSQNEVLPTYTRSMKFKLTVRDNHVEDNGVRAGGTNNLMQNIDVTDTAGPFIVTSQNEENQSLEANQPTIVNWEVANTDSSPINCANVNIYLSIDSGKTFDLLLKENTTNDGNESVIIPNITAEKARIMVKASNNVFFNINNKNFSIEKNTLGIEDVISNNSGKNISFTPNPANEIIKVLGNTTEEVNISIYTLLGVEVLNKTGRIIDVSTIPSGMYLICAKHKTKSTVGRFIKL